MPPSVIAAPDCKRPLLSRLKLACPVVSDTVLSPISVPVLATLPPLINENAPMLCNWRLLVNVVPLVLVAVSVVKPLPSTKPLLVNVLPVSDRLPLPLIVPLLVKVPVLAAFNAPADCKVP